MLGIEGFQLVDLTAPTLLGIGILMLMTGKLWTNAAYREKCKEADRWERAYKVEREARSTSEAQTAELLEVAKTTHNVINAMFGTTSAATRRRITGGGDT